MKRLFNIDALKGFAILLVVLGHAIQPNDPSHDSTIAFRVIYSFHMPLFMFLSGYLAWDRRLSLVKKAITLLVPFVSWYCISYLVTGTYQHLSPMAFLWRVILDQDWGLWFLWVLFANFFVLSLALRVPRRYQDLAVVAAAVSIKFVSIPWEIVGFELIQWYFTFFAAGYLIAKHQSSLIRWRRPAQVVSIVFFPFLVSFWYKSDSPSFLPYLRDTFSAYNLPGLDLILSAYAYVVPSLGIVLAFLLISVLQHYSIFAALCWLGLVTMEIFLSHELFIYFLTQTLGAGGSRIVPYFLSALILSLTLSFLLRRSKLLSLALLGKQDRQLLGARHGRASGVPWGVLPRKDDPGVRPTGRAVAVDDSPLIIGTPRAVAADDPCEHSGPRAPRTGIM
ncbi:MAG: hypothetical protein EPO21_12150 [Chloroflexota bacterium]|nr:MAG: hypothetical protein EPO21_12150 [Chloroflexota bacterium]